MELARFLYSVEDGFDSSGVKLCCSFTLPEKVAGTEIQSVNKMLQIKEFTSLQSFRNNKLV